MYPSEDTVKTMPIRHYAGAACAALVLLVAGPRVASAQYFGQNQVQYQTFDFQVLQTPHFDIYFYAQEQEAAQTAGRIAERWHNRLTGILQDSLSGRQPLILYASPSHFRQTNTVAGVGDPTAMAGGIAEALITTAAGLIIAVPAFMAYRYLRGRVDSLVIRMEKESLKLVQAIDRTIATRPGQLSTDEDQAA